MYLLISFLVSVSTDCFQYIASSRLTLFSSFEAFLHLYIVRTAAQFSIESWEVYYYFKMLVCTFVQRGYVAQSYPLYCIFYFMMNKRNFPNVSLYFSSMFFPIQK